MKEQIATGLTRRENRSTVALLVWTGVIVMAGILPLHNFVGHSHWEYIQWTVYPRQWRSVRFYFDVIANMALFYPFGLLLARRFPGARRAQTVALVGSGLLLSAGIEFFQVYCHNRHPSPVDLVSNTIGTALGVTTAVTVFALRWLDAWLPSPHSHPTGS